MWVVKLSEGHKHLQSGRALHAQRREGKKPIMYQMSSEQSTQNAKHTHTRTPLSPSEDSNPRMHGTRGKTLEPVWTQIRSCCLVFCLFCMNVKKANTVSSLINTQRGWKRWLLCLLFCFLFPFTSLTLILCMYTTSGHQPHQYHTGRGFLRIFF